MIKSWTDTDGTVHYAAEDSKAYRNRTERNKGEERSTTVVTPAEPADAARRPKTKTDETTAG